MNKLNIINNSVTIIGMLLILAIAQPKLYISIIVMILTIIYCIYDTKKQMSVKKD